MTFVSTIDFLVSKVNLTEAICFLDLFPWRYATSLGGSRRGTVIPWAEISWVNHMGFPQERFEHEWECTP